MILKRLLMAALGAIGLGALAAGSASAQQIPAPDAYQLPSDCSAAYPAPGPAGPPPKDHPLDKAIEAGAVGDTLLALMGDLCDVNGAAKTGYGDPVADGVGMARSLNTLVTEAKARLDIAQKAYSADDSAGNLSALEDAQKTHTEAVANRDNYAGGGAVYEAVFTEQMRAAQATSARDTWATAHKAAADAHAKAEGVEYSDFVTQFAGFDANGDALEFELYKSPDNPETTDNESVTYVRIKDAKGKIVTPAVDRSDPANPTYSVPDDLAASYIDHTATFTAGTSEFSGTTATFEVVAIDHDFDNSTTDEGTIRIVTLNATGRAAVINDDLRFGQDGTDDTADGIDDIYKAAKDASEAADKAAKDNKNVDAQNRFDERARKAKAVYDFYKKQHDKAYQQLAAGELSAPAGVDDPTTAAVETDGYEYTSADYRARASAVSDRDTKALALKSAYDALVAANNAVEASLKDAGSYLGQLVELREYEKSVADKAATDAGATEPTAGQKAADKALMAAQGQLKTYQDNQALSDDDPVKQLVNSLLEANNTPGDDDGQALVNAIGAVYDTAKSAADNAQKVVDELTGEGGAVATNTANIATNTMAIETNAGNIETNTANIATNTMAIETNAGNIETNAENIATNTMAIETNAENIETNATNIAMNAENIATNATNIAANADNIAMNATNIATNAGDIAMNTAAIATNAADIMTNADAIMANSQRLDTHEAMVMANAADIAGNQSAISMHTQQISGLVDELEVVKAGVAAGIAMASMPAVQGSGISVGVGSFDGESAFAVGYQYGGERVNFQIGVSSSGGETGAGAGVSFAIGQ